MKVVSCLSIVLLCLRSVTGAKVTPPPDVEQLIEFADFASIAYCVNKNLDTGPLKTSCSKPFCKAHEKVEIVKMFDFNESRHLGQGFYALDHEKKRVILTFRGTSSYIDWLQDFDIVQVPYQTITPTAKENKCKDCKVHRGFHKFVTSNCDSIVKDVKQLLVLNPNYDLVIIGHSLGGALAHLTGLEFQVMGYHPLVVTFGEPMVGNCQFAEFSNSQFQMVNVADTISSNSALTGGHIRVVHINDPVPHQPLLPSYSYCGYEYFINKDSFPHGARNIERKGIKTGSSLFSSTSTWNPSKLIPENPISAAHRNYFRRITGCLDEYSQ